MNPSPYLLQFSGDAFQKWTCPSTTKYFSPSFSYKALSSFSRSTIRKHQAPGRIVFSFVPPLKQDLSLGQRPDRDRPKTLWVLGLTSFPRLKAGRASIRLALCGADDKRLWIAGQPRLPASLDKVSRSRWARA